MKKITQHYFNMISLKIKNGKTNEVFEKELESIEQAIQFLSDYENQNDTFVRHYEKGTNKRIIGGKLEKIK